MRIDGRGLLADGIISDVTSTISTRLARWKPQERIQEIFESCKAAIGYLALNERFVLTNEAVTRRIGYAQEELLGKARQDLTPPEFRSLQAEQVGRMLQMAEPVEDEKEYIWKTAPVCRSP